MSIVDFGAVYQRVWKAQSHHWPESREMEGTKVCQLPPKVLAERMSLPCREWCNSFIARRRGQTVLQNFKQLAELHH